MSRSTKTAITFFFGIILAAYVTVVAIKQMHKQMYFNTLSLSREDPSTQSCVAHNSPEQSEGYFAGCGGFF